MIPLFRLNKLKPETIKAYLNKHGETPVYIQSMEHGAYWRANKMGYCYSLSEAGIYSLKEAYEASGHCDKSKGINYIRVS